jgi:hypothetical protein
MVEEMKQALHEAFRLGKEYWYHENAFYTGHYAEADKINASFELLVNETLSKVNVEDLQHVAKTAWADGYAAGVSDERTSEQNIGIAGFNAKVDPARENPYEASPAPVQELTQIALDSSNEAEASIKSKGHKIEMMKDYQTRLAEARARQEAALIRVKQTPPPAGQKFAPGEQVFISTDIGRNMGHFQSGKIATVLYTHAHAYQSTEDKIYCLYIDGIGEMAWFEECQLSKVGT